MTVPCVLEVIACSVDDAINAAKGGADRLEVISSFDSGGFTPPLNLVREIQQRVELPLRVMVRDEEGYEVSGQFAMEKLCREAYELNALKIDGIVIGFLRSDQIDIQITKKILACAPDLRATFHHAFEDADDKTSAIAELKQIGRIDRILSHGGFGTNEERVANLCRYASAADPQIEILAGGRVDCEMISSIREQTSIREFHVGSAARDEGEVSVSKVRALSEQVHKDHA